MSTKKFDWGRSAMFGVGVVVEGWNAGWMIVIHLPFCWFHYCTDPTS